MKLATIASSAASLLLAVALTSGPTPVEAARRGAPWGADSRWAGRLLKGRLDWYHHWGDGPINTDAEYVPTFWGPSQWGKWNTRKQEMFRNMLSRLLAFNEPDIKSQANMSPEYAAQVYKDEICPWQRRGVKMDSFLSHLRRSGGCEPNFLAIHWYGRKDNIEGFKSFVRKGWAKYGKSVWITECGLTAASNPSTAEVESFLRRAVSWVDSQDYVKRFAWTGVFAVSNPPDGFISNRVAMFNNDGGLRSTAYIMQYE